MTVARFPSLAHWGAFTALVEREAALIPRTGARPIVPEWIGSRVEPLR